MAEFKQEKVDVGDLVLGMYVAKLDRPWVGTPFPIQGFHIKSYDEIRTLATYCKCVYVDAVKSKVSIAPRRQSTPPPGAPFVNLKVNDETYEKTKTLKQEIGVASHLHQDVTAALNQVMDKISAGKPVALPTIKKVANKMVNSIARNPDAFTWVTRIRDKDAYTYGHSVRSSIWAITFGRHLGIKRPTLENLASGVLLAEVGKIKLPTELLTKRERLTDKEFAEMKKYVAYSVEILRSTKGTNDEILSVVSTHHERHNGTGYPQGLKGDQIPLLGKIAGIVEFYDSVTNPRYDEKALSSVEAMSRLHEMRNEDFQSELAEEFIQSIGIYPTGTLIELSTGEVGVITEQNIGRRLRPKVMLILDKEKAPLKSNREIDLLTKTKTDEGQAIDITKSLPEGAYDIDLARYRKNILSRFFGLGNTLFRH